MKRKEYFLLYFISTTFYAILTMFIRIPGYMDANYYYAGGIQIATGNGAIEPYIWNYLSSPTLIPVPSFSYWMPFTSILAAGGMKFLGSTGFNAARLLFVLLAGLIPVISASISEHILPGKRAGWIAGGIAMVSTYYLPYLTVTDSLTPYMVFGGLFILLLTNVYENKDKPLRYTWWKFIGLGLITGVMHLSRADGVLWLLVCFLTICLVRYKNLNLQNFLIKISVPCIMVAVSYILILSPWFYRNILQFHSLFPPGNGLLVLATGYDDIFFFDPSVMTLDRFFSQGLGEILTDRFYSLWMNFKSLLLVNGGIVLVPMIIVAAWSFRKNFMIQITLSILLVNLLFMSFVFPYAGYRGGFFHSNSAIQSVLWGVTPIGLEKIISLGVRYRGWKLARAWKLFSVTLIAVCFALSGFIFITGDGLLNDELTQFKVINQTIINITGDKDSVIMVNDPPGFFLVTSRNAIQNPSDGIENLLLAAERFNSRFFVIDNNNTVLNADLEQGIPETVDLIAQVDGSRIYEINK